MCALALLLQMLLPASAQASGGTWVEICGEMGAELVLMDLSGDDTAPASPESCRNCCPCVLAGSTPSTIPPGEIALLSPALGFVTIASAPASNIPPNQAQFWPDNRGPPALNPNTTILDFLVMAPTRYATGGADA